MKSTLVLCTLLSIALSKPSNLQVTKGGSDGYFHQQYQYSSSSSSFKNNELEHKTDDEGFYSKHGDLTGRAEPKVDSYSQHSEYQNPKFQHGQGGQASQGNDFYIQQTMGNGGGLNSNYNSGSSLGYTNHNGQGYHSGLSGQYGLAGGLNSGSSGSSYKSGYSSSSSYSGGTSGGTLYPTGQLESLSQQLHNDLSRQLQQVLAEQRRHESSSSSSSYSYGTAGTANYGSNPNVQILEQELKNNLSSLLQDALNRQYGQQSQRGSNYYSVSSSGAQSSQPNYSAEDLERLRQQLEAKLIRELQEGVQTDSLQASRSSSSSSSTSFNTGTTGYSGYQPGSVNTQTIHLTPGSHNTNTFGSSASQRKDSSYSSGVYAPNPSVHLTDITDQIENNLADQLNQAVSQKIQKYQSSSSYSTSYSTSGNPRYPSQPDYQTELQSLTEELKNNLTRQLNDEIAKNYGRQEQRGSYYYTITSGVPQSAPNYRVDELETLKQQVQDKLVRQLQDKFRQQYNQHTQSSYGSSSSQYSSGSSYSTSGNTGTQYGTTGTVYPASTGTHGSYGTSAYTNTNGMQYIPGSFVIVGNVPNQLQDVTKELYSDLTQQLQAALAEQQRRYQHQSASYSSSTSYSPQYDQQLILQQLTDELKRNLTQQLDQSLTKHYGRQNQKGSSYYTISTGGAYLTSPNYNTQQLNDVTSQLQDSLLKQLQQGLSQQSSAYSSYSANASYKTGMNSGTNGAYAYNPTYSHNGQHTSYNRYSQSSGSTGVLGDDCDEMQGDDNFSHHQKGYLTQQQEQATDSFNKKKYENQGYVPQTYGQVHFGGQQTMDSQDLTQQTEDEMGQLQIGGQQTMDDLTQQTEDEMGQLHIGGQQTLEGMGQLHVGSQQQVDSQDLVQQTQNGFGQLQIGNQQQQEIVTERGQMTESVYDQLQHQTDFTQQTQYGQHQHHHQKENGYQKPTYAHVVSGHNQQTEQVQRPHHFGNLELGGQQQTDLTQQTMDDLTQQVDHGSSGQLQIGGQQTMDDLTQQVEHGSSGQLQIGSQQQVDSQDLVQQTQDGFGQLQIGNQQHQTDLTQQTELGQHQQIEQIEHVSKPHHVGNLEIGSQQQTDLTQQTMDDLTQQVEHGSSGQLQIGGQQTVDDLTQQVEHGGSGQLQIGGQHQIHLSQQQENFGQQQTDLTQQQEDIEEVTHRYEVGKGQLHLGSLDKLQVQGQQQHATQLTEGNRGDQKPQLTQQTEDGFGGQQQVNVNSGLTQQTEDNGFQIVSQQRPAHGGINGNFEFGSKQTGQLGSTSGTYGQHKYNEQHAYSQSSQYSSSSYNQNSYHSGYGKTQNGSPFTGQLHYGTPQQVDISETTSDLGQQQIEKQNAQLLESLNKHIQDQKQSNYNGYSSNSNSYSSSSHLSGSYDTNYGEQSQQHDDTQVKSNSEVEPIKNIEEFEATGKPQTNQTFWHKVGNKIEHAYTNAKQKAGTLIDKISTSVG